jgi:hypothetical protein
MTMFDGKIEVDWKKWERANNISLWTRIRLWFQPVKYSVDWGGPGEYSVTVVYKVLDGVTYILEERPHDGN